jgi:nitroreductase
MKGNKMENPTPRDQANRKFTDADRAAVYQAIFSRRDVRGQFTNDPISDDVLSRILMAAHYAPSVHRHSLFRDQAPSPRFIRQSPRRGG